MSLTSDMLQIDRQVKLVLRSVNPENLNRDEVILFRHLKQICNEARLDVRDYEYADTRAAQRKAAVSARRNLAALNKDILALDTVFGAADVAELSARIHQIIDTLD